MHGRVKRFEVERDTVRCTGEKKRAIELNRGSIMDQEIWLVFRIASFVVVRE